MRFATLILEQDLHRQVCDALSSIGVELIGFADIDSLVDVLRAQSFAAIVFQDHEDLTRPWLHALRTHADERTALIATGAGGTAGMSRALLHGADDYVVIGDGTEQLVHRAIARVNAKTQHARKGAWRLGPYTLDRASSSLVSPVAELRLAPRELMLAQILIENHGRVVKLERLCQELCERTDETARRAVKQHAHTLRKKCERAAGATLQPLRVEAVYGKGYRIAF